MTPETEDADDLYSPASPEPEPMNIGHLNALEVDAQDEDLAPAVGVVSTHDDMVCEMLEDNIQILEVLAQLGANTKQYRRERSRAVKALVSEIYSSPRVTKAA